MNKNDIPRKLRELAQLDIDAVYAYDQALKKIEQAAIRAQLVSFREDHLKHITTLAAVLRDLRQTPPEYSPDFKGYLIQGMTSLLGITGTSGALKAMQANEKLTNKKYQAASGWPTEPAVTSIITAQLLDERRHLAFIEEAIENKRWEQ